MKAILISIKPKWVAKILNGEKTIEIRKSMPKCDLPIDVYIYCSKDKQNLLHKNCADIYWVEDIDFKAKNKKLGLKTQPYLNGKVVAKFTLNKVEEIHQNCQIELGSWRYYENEEIIEELACLDNGDLQDYLDMKTGYAWHISNLVIFENPKELSDFKIKKKHTRLGVKFDRTYETIDVLTKAPQSWQFIEVE